MASKTSDSLSRIIEWLQSNAEAALDNIQGPATVEEIDAVATQLNVQFPDDLRQFYQLLDGAESSGIFPSCDEWDDMAFSPMSLKEVIQNWRMLKKLVESGEFADSKPRSADGIASDWWNVAWIPFADNGGGDYYCIDMAPTEVGIRGQVISHSHESGEHKVLARSLGQYLHELANELEMGVFEYDDDYGVRTKDEDDEDEDEEEDEDEDT